MTDGRSWCRHRKWWTTLLLSLLAWGCESEMPLEGQSQIRFAETTAPAGAVSETPPPAPPEPSPPPPSQTADLEARVMRVYEQAGPGRTILGVFAICLSVDPSGAVTTANRKGSWECSRQPPLRLRPPTRLGPCDPSSSPPTGR